MFRYIENNNTNPHYNLAFEQTVFERLDKQYSYCILWQNRPSVIVGRHQNTHAEINRAYVEANDIAVARRISGGGAVYHDLGNVNFTFITGISPESGIDFAPHCRPIRDALVSLGVPAEIYGRNDMVIEGKKFSGNAQYIRDNRVMHHGTLLYDTDLEMLSKVLNARDKIETKGIKSVRSRVTNIRPYMRTDMPVGEFIAAVKAQLFASLNIEEYSLTPEELSAAEILCKEKNSQWSWNYGESPPYTIRKNRFFEGCGTVEALIGAEKGDVISAVTFHGDFFGTGDPAVLAETLSGLRLQREELAAALRDIDVTYFFHGLDTAGLLSLLTE